MNAAGLFFGISSNYFTGKKKYFRSFAEHPGGCVSQQIKIQMHEYKIASSNGDYLAAAELFREYAAWLNIDLSFQDFEKELAMLPVMYAKENGGIILCRSGDGFVGCVGIRRISGTEAEMKRMWVRRGFEGAGIGRELLEKAIELAAVTGYRKIKLDTLNDMLPAMNLYKKYGFREIPAYYNNPDKRAVYFEKEL